MADIITLVDETKTVIEQKIKEFIQEENRLSKEIIDTERSKLLLEATVEDLKGQEKKDSQSDIKKIKAAIKLLQQEFELIKAKREEAEQKLFKLNANQNKVYVTKNTQDSVLKTFQDSNIHYVISGRKWWRVEQDTAGNIRIKDHDYPELRDLVFLATDWEINDEMEVKRFAKDHGRLFKDIVRDFTTNAPGIYNQMSDIQRYWLTPDLENTPHPAFDLLMMSIAGGNSEYADQIEKLVAYRYCHPDDVMIPNLDSCAVGGTGRDTLWNMLRIIFTDECCGEVSEETFKGTHNGDLFGKMWVKVNEQSSSTVPIDKIKAYTGDNRYRDRRMGTDARDAVRLFTFWLFRNGFTTTAKLAGSGSSGEDRRWEPVIARINLARHVALFMGLINDINEIPTEENEQLATREIKKWQKDYYKNRAEIAKWLGYIIKKHNILEMKELLPLHGQYYKEMIVRQRKGIDVFMPKFMALFDKGDSTVIHLKKVYELYQVAENAKVTKDWFKNQIMYWLNTKMGWDCVEEQQQIYPFKGASSGARSFAFHVYNNLDIPQVRIFNVEDFIDVDALDDKGNTVGEKINQYSLRDELK
jgi:hypothetical protein